MKIYYKLSVTDWLDNPSGGNEWPLCYTSHPNKAIKEYLKQGHKVKNLRLYPMIKKK